MYKYTYLLENNIFKILNIKSSISFEITVYLDNDKKIIIKRDDKTKSWIGVGISHLDIKLNMKEYCSPSEMEKIILSNGTPIKIKSTKQLNI